MLCYTNSICLLIMSIKFVKCKSNVQICKSFCLNVSVLFFYIYLSTFSFKTKRTSLLNKYARQ